MNIRLNALLSILLLTGCATGNPLQIPDEEWAQMSSEQRLRARESQARLDQQRAEIYARQQRLEAIEEQKRLEQERQHKAEQERQRQHRYQHARYGDIVQCVLDSGKARRSKGWRRTDPMIFEVMRGDRIDSPLYDHKGREIYRMTISLSYNSQTVSLCINNARQCDSMETDGRSLRRGIDQKIGLGEKVKGTLHCSYKYLPARY